MLRFFTRLKSRKAFTIVELIIVLGIITVLAGITIPMSMSAGLTREAASKAKSFYYALQNTLVEYRSQADEAPFYKYDDNGTEVQLPAEGYMYIEATATKNSGDDGYVSLKVGILDPAGAGSIDTRVSYDVLATAYEDEQLRTLVNRYSTDDEYGFFYALVDGSLRVVSTYWCSLPFYEMYDGIDLSNPALLTFTNSDMIGNFVISSYPPELSMKDRELFTLHG